MSKNPETIITLPDGTAVTLRPPTVWDSVLFREQFGRNVEAIAMEKAAIAAMTPEEREEFDAFRNRAMLWLCWRCAASGGFEGTEEDFWKRVPMTGAHFTEIIGASTDFFGGLPEPETSPDSSAPG